MAQRRFQFFLADLVAVIALCGLAVALVLALPRRAGFGVIGFLYFLIFAVVIVWMTFRRIREAPACQECGRRFIPPRTKSPRPLCPRCGHAQLSRRRSDKALAISYRTVMGLTAVVVVLLVELTRGVGGASGLPPLWVSLAWSTLPTVFSLLLTLFLVLVVVRATSGADPVGAMSCQKCGYVILPPPTAEPLICRHCRQRDLPRQQLGKQQATGFGIIFAVLLAAGVVMGFMLTAFAGSNSRLSYWVAIPLVVVGTVVGVPVIFVVAFLSRQFVRLRRLKDERYVLARAREASGDEGEVAKTGQVTLWYSHPPNPVLQLMEQMRATRSSLESLLGSELPTPSPLQILCFRKRSAFEAFLKPYFGHLSHRLRSENGLYIRPPYRIMTLCGDEAPDGVLDRDKTAPALFCLYLFHDAFPLGGHAPWLPTGVTGILASDDEGRARLNRKMLVSLKKGSALGADLFKMSDKVLMKLHQNWADHRAFERLSQFSAESWSVCEYLAGNGATVDRRERFRAFVNDNQSKEQPDEVLKRYFGFDCAQLVGTWRAWVEQHGIGTIALPRPVIQEALRNRVIPRIEDRRALRGDRIMAIRSMGIGAYAVGADALIDLLRSVETIPKEELVWALEAISGMAYGEDHDRWAAWWSTLPAEIREWRSRPERAGETAAVAPERSFS
jgi:hypothetical protein